ncbi:WD40-repeat-containing domain protein [Bisporella sp. PMI_857]|nr:WD40-repeat-containing domain protein [Bisporella sp. PMI_857]
MAVTAESFHQATDSLILPDQRLYYQTSIFSSHWQLRSLIASPEQDVIYYPGESNIYALYTKTKERQLITSLPFVPRCLTVAGGWICCGGHNGNFAVVSLNDGRRGAETIPSLGSDPDARLPMELNPPRRTLSRTISPPSRRSRSPRYPISANVKKIGVETKKNDDAINNCTTLWFPKDPPSERTYKSPVAVIANNDCSVYILDLEDSEILERFVYPSCVNRAEISPDGELLVAVTDDPFLYIYQRRRRQELTPGLFSAVEHYEWYPACRIQLTGQKLSELSNMKGSFALSFSSSGKYLAVSTQRGVISIFDTRSLVDERTEPLSIFSSSRPDSPLGAVRAMEFSPGSVDLLAWTESNGKVEVADIRTLFTSRQLLNVDSRRDEFEKIYISDRPESVSSRRRNLRSSSPSLIQDYLGLDFDARQLRQMARDMLDRHQAPITPEEQEILQAHRVARRQRDANAALADAESLLWGQGNPSSSLLESLGVGPTSTSSSRNPIPPLRTFRVSSNSERNPSFRSIIHDRERREVEHQPRRRPSIILATAERAMEHENIAASSGRHGNDTSTSLEQLTITTPCLPEPSSNPWEGIDALCIPQQESSGLRVTRDVDARTASRQPWRPLGNLVSVVREGSDGAWRSVYRPRVDDEEERSPHTMGICWSPDGKILYVGAEDGIYEYHVNMNGRKMAPSIVLR